VTNLQSVRDNVAQALEPSLDELQRRLEERADHPLVDALSDEYRQIRTSLDSWPQLVSAHVARQLWARIDTIRRLLDVIDGGQADAAAAPSLADGRTPTGIPDRPRGVSLPRRDAVEAEAPFVEGEEYDDSLDDSPAPNWSSASSRPARRVTRAVALLPARPVRPITTEPYRVDRVGAIDPRLAVLSDPDGSVTAAYRSLFIRIRARSAARSWMVTTVAAEEDGSTCAANLALAVASAVNEPVLLIEARVAKPQLGRLLGFEPRECFAGRLAQHLRHPDAPWPVAQLGESNLHVLAVAQAQQQAPPLDISALEDVVSRFASHPYAYVVVDGPATTLTSDGPYLARCAQGVVVALHAGVTRQESVRRASQILNGTPVLAYVLIKH
jgi:Mrp family chromosome partitioning ATPase